MPDGTYIIAEQQVRGRLHRAFRQQAPPPPLCLRCVSCPLCCRVLSRSPQVLFYTLDTLPILLCFAVFAWAHPSWLLPSSSELPQQAAPAKGASNSSRDSSGGPKGGSGAQAGQQQMEQFQSVQLDV